MTRRMAKHKSQHIRDLDANSDDEAGADTDLNEWLTKETFLGVKTIMERARLTKLEPVIFIIKNIKLFNPHVLNDLIHMLKKYRN